MRVIHKRIVTDEDMQPVAVQIDYGDWLEIERLLELHDQEPRATDLSAYSGVVRLTEDPLDYQERMRNEWP